MIFDYSLAALVTAGLLIYLVYALLKAGTVLKG
jgi:K+-transporting ATPase KdpF subunit